mmetsp:Transcript_16826/g.50256  ORF Transcript_16826/g.50256 Transcript_16826/m.50256 type:complete len:248 (-) Transcript_16826:882-1625(-)
MVVLCCPSGDCLLVCKRDTSARHSRQGSLHVVIIRVSKLVFAAQGPFRGLLDQVVDVNGAAAEGCPGLVFNLLEKVLVLHDEGQRLLSTLGKVFVHIAIPGALARQDADGLSSVENASLTADAAAEHDVELRHLVGRRTLVLQHLGLHPDANVLSVGAGTLDGGLAPHLQPHAGIELESVAPASNLWVAVNHPHLVTQLIEEKHSAIALGGVGSNLAQRVTHQPSLSTNLHSSDLSLNLSARHQGSD